jgi:hypothetical protein
VIGQPHERARTSLAAAFGSVFSSVVFWRPAVSSWLSALERRVSLEEVCDGQWS